MSLPLLLIVGLAVAVFVGVNIGGSSTGVAFGPATGSGVITMRQAGLLMAVFVLVGGFTVGTNVVDTLGTDFVPSAYFTLGASIGVLGLTGFSILLGNFLKISVSTSETAVGSVVGMGVAYGVLNVDVVLHVLKWWFLSAVIAFWVSAVIGRYLYEHVVAYIDLGTSETKTITNVAVVAIGCYMAFSAGASNVANAVAPLVGSGHLAMTPGVALGGLAIGAGGLLLGHRTMETIGEGITDLPVEGALIVEVVAATIITALSSAGIPASLAITATTCVIGLGWGRATRRLSLTGPTTEGKTMDNEQWRAERFDLYDPSIAKRIVSAWFLTPSLAGVLAFLVFEGAIRFGLL